MMSEQALRPTIVRLCQIVAAIVLFLAAVEIQVRLFLPELDPAGHFYFRQGNADRPPLGVANSTQRQINKSGDFNVLFHINSLGLRDEKLVSYAGPGDIVALGDSFTMGFGVEQGERYSDLLARIVERPVFNLALPGTLADQLKLLRYARALGSAATRVVIGIVLESAVRIYEPDELDLLKREPAAALSTPPVEGPGRQISSWREFLNTRSAAYVAITTAMKRNQTINGFMEKTGLASPARPITGNYSDEEIGSTTEYLQSMLRGYDPVIVLLPTKNAFSGPNRSGINSGLDRLERGLRTQFDVVLDLRPLFLTQAEPLRAYFPNEGHWNTHGHSMAATAIAARIPDAWKDR